MSVRVQREDFEPGAESARLQGQNAGAIVSFVGVPVWMSTVIEPDVRARAARVR